MKNIIPAQSRDASETMPDEKNAGRTLFILAGMPGSGKTRLLHLALQRQMPIFGTADDPLFQQTRRPTVYPDERMSLDERLRLGTWISEVHLLRLPAARTLTSPVTFVAHLDLFWFFQMLQRLVNPPLKLAPADYLSADVLSDPATTEAAYRALLTVRAFRQWDRILINTIQPAYARTAAQWHDRESVLRRPPHAFTAAIGRFLRDELYDHTERGQRVYDALYQGWQRASGVLAPRARWLTQVDNDGAFRIRPAA